MKYEYHAVLDYVCVRQRCHIYFLPKEGGRKKVSSSPSFLDSLMPRVPKVVF